MAFAQPEVITGSASLVKATSARVYGTIRAYGKPGKYLFQYGTTTNYGKNTDLKEFEALNTITSKDETLTDLEPNTTYHYRLVASYNTGLPVLGEDKTFTTLADGSAPSVTTYDADQITATSARLNCSINPNGILTRYRFEYGTTSSCDDYTDIEKVGSGTSAVSKSMTITGLRPNTHYYFRATAYNDKGQVTRDSRICSFTTLQEEDYTPEITSVQHTNVTNTSVTLKASINTKKQETYYHFEYGTTTAYGSFTSPGKLLSGRTTAAPVSDELNNLSPGTTYHYRVVASSDKGGEVESYDYTFKTTGTPQPTYDSPFSDCPSPEQCGSTNYGDKIYEAAVYLYNKGIVKGVNGKLLPDEQITRAQLAKLALYGLYGGETKVPSTLVSDNFPSIYADLQDKSAYYYRPAKAMLYLEYKDGVSPFDRNRSTFNPENPIERNLTMKVLCETFNIKPLTSGGYYFDDFTSGMNCWGYAAKAKDLGITEANQFKPYTKCTRGDAILFLYRMLTKVSAPTPNNTENIASSDFFIPANYKPQNSNALRGIASGNFNYYEKDFFNIDGYMPLNFGVSYNSCLTEMPGEFYPVSPMGQAWSHSYNTYMNIIESTDNSSEIYVVHKSDGSMLMYDSSLRSLSEGNYLKLTRNSSSQYTLATPTKTVYTFDRATVDGIFYLTKITDIHGTEKTINYETGSNHRRVSSVSTLGRSLKFSYTGADFLASVTDPSGRSVSFSYSNGVLASLTDAKGQRTTFNYGTTDAESGLLKTITLPKGNTVKNNYQQRKLTSTQTNSDTPTTVSISPSYANGRTTSSVTQPITSSKTLTTQFTMDSAGKVTSAVDNESTDISITYGDSSNPTLPTRVKNNLSGVTSSLSYNSYGLPTSTSVSGGGVSTSSSMTYNSNNQVTSTTDGNGNTTNYSYSNGALTTITDALGNVTRFTNNSYGSPTQITDAAGRRLNISYNSYGNMTRSTISALGISNSYVYDAISRVTKATDGNGNSSTYSYDNNDNLLSFTDAKSNTISYKYDANDNLTSITNARGGVTALTYNNDDLLTGQSFQGHSKSFTYYDSGALKTSTTADGTTFSYTYDDAGRITDNDYASFSYNSRGQLISVSKDGKDVDYSYDGLGRTSSVEYDGKEVSYDYDNNGNVTAITYPGGKTVSYSYDALNRVTAVTDWNGAKTTYSYNADGSLDYVQLPNRVKTSYSYDGGGRLTGMSTKRSNGSTIVGYGYTLDDNGNHVNVETNDVFDHAPVLSAEDITYSYNNDNRITKAGSISFGFDGNGNTTSRSGRTMRYDKENNLTSVSGDFSATYTYDGLGQRRSATRDGVTTKYVLSGGNVVAETNNSGTVQYYYVYGPTGLISRISASGDTRYYVADVRGSIVAMTDATTSANLTHKYQYDEFGKVTSFEEENINRFRYVGNKGVMYEADNLTFMRARYYDESIGRFLSEDPIWSTNLYPYCENNPVMFVDPEGEEGYPILSNFADPEKYEAAVAEWERNQAKKKVAKEITKNADKLKGNIKLMRAAEVATQTIAVGGTAASVYMESAAQYSDGFSDKLEGKNVFWGTIKACGEGVLVGGAGGTAIGFAFGGVGAGPGAAVGAIAGCLDSSVSYTVGAYKGKEYENKYSVKKEKNNTIYEL